MKNIISLVGFYSIGLQFDLSAQDFLPGRTWLDANGIAINAHGGGVLFHQGTYYWFGEHKIAGDAGNFAHAGVRVYSSKTLGDWHDEGIALPVASATNSEIARGCILERPKVVFNPQTKKFVMWFHLELLGQGYSSARSGVAVADKAAGPYTYLGSFRPNVGVLPLNVSPHLQQPLVPEQARALAKALESGEGAPDEIFRRDFATGQMSRDLTLFVDDDGKAYQLYASEENKTLHISQLSDDFLRPAGKFVRIFPGDSNEAPALFKHDGYYYLITSGCTGWAPNPARLFRAKSIWGPWEKLGNPCRGTPEQMARTFDAQSTYILPVQGKSNAFVFMADRWNPTNAIDGRYVWLPLQFGSGGIPFLEWKNRWDMSSFVSPKPANEKTAVNPCNRRNEADLGIHALQVLGN